jgi:hypothetical protein
MKVLLLKQLKTNSINAIVAYKFFETKKEAEDFSRKHKKQENEYLFMLVFNDMQEMSND